MTAAPNPLRLNNNIMKDILTVTQYHIDSALLQVDQNQFPIIGYCPAANALKDKFHIKFVEVGYRNAFLYQPEIQLETKVQFCDKLSNQISSWRTFQPGDYEIEIL